MIHDALVNVRQYGTLVCLCLIIIACGAPQPVAESLDPTSTPGATFAAATRTPDAPAASSVPAPASTATHLAPSPVLSADPTPVPVTETVAANDALYNGLPQGRTADGAPALGVADAPVILTDYSDFL